MDPRGGVHRTGAVGVVIYRGPMKKRLLFHSKDRDYEIKSQRGNGTRAAREWATQSYVYCLAGRSQTAWISSTMGSCRGCGVFTAGTRQGLPDRTVYSPLLRTDCRMISNRAGLAICMQISHGLRFRTALLPLSIFR